MGRGDRRFKSDHPDTSSPRKVASRPRGFEVQALGELTKWLSFVKQLVMTRYAGVKELRQNMMKYARHVGRGGEVVVLKHNKPLFKMCRVEDPFGDEGEWESVINFTKMRKGGVSAEEILAALKKIEAEDKRKSG